MRRADPIASPTLWVAVLFVALLFGMPQLAPLFQWSFPGVSPPVFERGSFFALWLSHAGLVLVAGGAATIIGIALAIFVTRPAGRDFRALISTLAAVGQTFPPAAVLALAVPALGFGPRPTIIALFLYGLLPIVAVPIAIVTETRTPARITGAASGRSTARNNSQADSPMPRAASRVAAGTPSSPATAFSMIGKRP